MPCASAHRLLIIIIIIILVLRAPGKPGAGVARVRGSLAEKQEAAGERTKGRREKQILLAECNGSGPEKKVW